MLIHVTAEDIAKGSPLDASSCPIALALKRHIWKGSVLVYGSEAFIDGEQYFLAKQCAEFVSRFDDNIPVAPFSFEIPEIPACN